MTSPDDRGLHGATARRGAEFMALDLGSNAMNRSTLTSGRGVLQEVDFST